MARGAPAAAAPRANAPAVQRTGSCGGCCTERDAVLGRATRAVDGTRAGTGTNTPRSAVARNGTEPDPALVPVCDRLAIRAGAEMQADAFYASCMWR